MLHPALRKHPERTAWLVVSSAFVVFCLLLVVVPLSVRYVLLYSMVGHPPMLQTIEGTAVVDDPESGSQFAVGKGYERKIEEGFAISLDESTRADLVFFDGSLVHLFPGSRVSLERARGPRFSLGVRPNTIWLRVVSGQLKVVTTSPPQPGGLDFTLRCPGLGAEVSIDDDGVYRVEAESTGVEVFAYRGSAAVTAAGKLVRLVAPERTTVKAGKPPNPPIADARELIKNGDFRESLEEGWTVRDDEGNDGPSVKGQAVRTVEEGLPAVRFYRTGSNRNHCETQIIQKINRELPDPVSSLVVRANLRLINQSLSGGGYQGSEFPLIIRLKYRDVYDSENEWVIGFYYENSDNNPVGNGILVPKDAWYSYESDNLLDKLDPQPFRIVEVCVYASGWDYESVLRWISIAVK